jgi:hypothetical protein
VLVAEVIAKTVGSAGIAPMHAAPCAVARIGAIAEHAVIAVAACGGKAGLFLFVAHTFAGLCAFAWRRPSFALETHAFFRAVAEHAIIAFRVHDAIAAFVAEGAKTDPSDAIGPQRRVDGVRAVAAVETIGLALDDVLRWFENAAAGAGARVDAVAVARAAQSTTRADPFIALSVRVALTHTPFEVALA